MRRKLLTNNSTNGAPPESWWSQATGTSSTAYDDDDEDDCKQVSIASTLSCALLIRIMLLLYGNWQDANMLVKYTDVDYYVFSDAAQYMAQGESPYKRLTYRYSPLLAWMLVPNTFVSKIWGKCVFVFCDLLAGYLIFRIQNVRYNNTKVALTCAQLWLFNPLIMTVSSRGNADSVMAVLVLSTIYCFTQRSKRRLIVGFLLHALSIHLRIYSITYTLPIYLLLSGQYLGYTVPSCYWKRIAGIDVWPNRYRMLYLLSASGFIVLLTALYYYMYDYEFIQQTYLYHITRSDARHNFSVYFYSLYLTLGAWYSPAISLMVFIPQAVLLLTVSVKYFTDLPYCCFLHTFIFVTFNKVTTSQYFLWYLCLLPVILPGLKITKREAIALSTLWLGGQAIWLGSAYFLEFEGQNAFFVVWFSSLVFFVINIIILVKLIRRYTVSPLYLGGERVLARSKLDLMTLGELARFYFSKEKVI